MNVEALARWYADEARDLPWRATSDPWSILLSEVLLQQTQVARGIEYWRRLLKRFPTVASMAEADLDDPVKVDLQLLSLILQPAPLRAFSALNPL